MRLVPDGPDLPVELLEAVEQDRAVFLCGAGISYPAGLPMFPALVERVYEKIGEPREPLEQAALEDSLLDRALGLLERRLANNAVQVRRAVRSILSAPPTVPLSSHQAILDLGRTSTGSLRIVTTNFDVYFETAASQRSEAPPRYFSAPCLPVPKPHRWNGLVYLHGRISDDDPDCKDLVYSSADFGAAYLTEGWASRFVTDLFRNFHVIFFGYSLNDPVMRYVADALDADRRAHAQSFLPAYALDADDPAGTATVAWEAKGVVPVLCPPGMYSQLHATLVEWARLRKEGRQSRRNILLRFLKSDPEKLLPDDISQVSWAITDRAAATTLSEAPAHNRWLPFLYRSSWGIDGVPIAGSLHASSPDDLYAPLATGAHELMRWIANTQLSTKGGIEWALSKSARLHPSVREGIRTGIARRPIGPVLRRFWHLITDDDTNRPADSLIAHRLLEQLRLGSWDEELRDALLQCLRPHLELRSGYGLGLGDEDQDWPNLKSLRDIIQGEVSLRSSHATPDLVRAIMSRTDRDKILSEMSDACTSLLVSALDQWALLGKASASSDLSYLHRPSIADHQQNAELNEWTSLITLAREAFHACERTDGGKARALLHRWRNLQYPTFERLVAHALSSSELWSSRQKTQFLLTGDLDA